MSKHRQRKSHSNKSYNVVNDGAKTKSIKPPGTPQRNTENVSDSSSKQISNLTRRDNL